MRLLPLFVTGLALAACSPAGDPLPSSREAVRTIDPVVDVGAIEGLVDQMEAGWRAGDGAAFAAPFAGDAYFTTWFGLRIEGREGIAAGHQQIFDTIYAGTAFEMEVIGVRFMNNNVALVRLDGWVVPADGSEVEGDAQVRPLLVAERGATGWEIAAFQNTPVQEQGAVGQ